MKPNNNIYQKCTEASFYRLWFEFLAPFHRLPSRERDVAARILAQWFRLKDTTNDPELLKELLWSKTSRQDMMASLGMSPAHFQLVLRHLKAANVLVDDMINPKYIPHKSDGDPRFMLQIVFDWSSASNPVRNETKQG